MQIELSLVPPQGAGCFAFDYVFYSEEYPEFVGQEYNDVFVAEVSSSDLVESNGTVSASSNFAFDAQGNSVSVNTVFGLLEENASGTTYDGATPLLTARLPLTSAEPFTVILSIMDLFDSRYDSAVFVDNFRWLDGACTGGSVPEPCGNLIEDLEPPEIVDMPGNLTLQNDLGVCGAIVTWEMPSATDNCGILNVGIRHFTWSSIPYWRNSCHLHS